MSERNLLIVESPAKAKTINKYLGSNFTVLASYGHVRDLPAKDGSVRPDEDFAMDWEPGDRSKKHIDAIAKAAKESDKIFLATDPDREGEAISWHVQEILRSKRGLKDADIQRVSFNEVTKRAVLDAIAHPRAVDRELVEAYLARRALDYLVGFTLSPVLWRKLPGSRSAGRVQSVALKLICVREAEIEAFQPREYWTVEVRFKTATGDEFTARLTHLGGKKLDKFGLADEDSAKRAVAALERLDFKIDAVERKQTRRNPSPPFTTSTLQQEASRKLGFSASNTMRTAQRLYEGVDIGGETVGLITYMRTDGLTLAQEALVATRDVIGEKFGAHYLPEAARVYKSKAKNAQEAHEAIRPTDLRQHPDDLARHLNKDEHRLYELIWKRTVACQMASAVMDQVAVDIDGGNGVAMLRANGSVVKFDGFLKVYEESRDEPAEKSDEDSQRRLPPVEEGQRVDRTATTDEQHFTQPPPRYSEASLVKRMEELGIGRPSTYASVLQVLQDRDYVRLEKRRFFPEDRGRLVTAFLTSFFTRYVEYDFTAKLEDQLDDISGGRIDWKTVLREFWSAFSEAIGETKDLSISQVMDVLDGDLGQHFFPSGDPDHDARKCPTCEGGRLALKLARNGAFIGCQNYPECRFTRPLQVMSAEALTQAAAYPRDLGGDPASGLPVSLRQGPYGIYVQLGEVAEDSKPKRVSLPKGEAPSDLTLERALGLLALPREIGSHPENGETISAGIGRFGPYLKLGNAYKSLTADEDILSIGMNRAVELLANAKARPAAEPLRLLGEHPKDSQPVSIFKGRYGPYVRHGRVMASLRKGQEVDTVTLEEAVELIAAKAGKKGGKAPAKKAATKKAPAKKATAKKTTAKKTSAKKPATGKSRAKSGPRTAAAGD